VRFPPDYVGKEKRGGKKGKEGKERVEVGRITKLQIALAIAVLIASVATVLAASGIISNIINTNITVTAPQQVSISLQEWPSSVTTSVNYTFRLSATNNNPTLPVRWILNFTRADGVQLNDFTIYYVVGENEVMLNKQVSGNTLIFTSNIISLPNGNSNHNFKITASRPGSYSVSIALTSS